jgi:1-acyl-sn-glycerol-3-phosphate acyltransferase
VRELERRVRARLTPAFPIEPRRRLPLELFWKRWRELAMQGRSDVVDEFGRDPRYAARVDPLLEFLYTRYFRVTTQGLEHIPATGRAIIVANHSGTLPYDGAMLMYAVRRDAASHRDVRPLVEDFVFHFPYLGTFMNRIGGVRACQENAERLLEKDQLVAVFPEGEKGIGKMYRERYRLQRFGRGGFIKLALRTGAPIIPAAIVGAEEIHPMVGKVTFLAKSLGLPYLPVTPTFPFLGPLGLVPLPTKWTLRFGAPIDYATSYGAAAAEDRILVNKLGETVRSTIQEMIDETLSERKSILFG